MRPVVSIVIPTRNGMDTLPGVFDAISRQQADADIELVCIDTASTDGTPDFAAACGATVLTVERGAFNHGLTRNAAIAATRGDFIVLLSQDAEPVGTRWLAGMVAPLLADPRIAGVSARQSLRPSAGAIARHYHAQWAGSSTVPRRSSVADPAVFDALPPVEKLQTCLLDNVCSCIRRTAWQQVPFGASAIAEDVAWARDVLLAGFSLVYTPEAVVAHSHDRPAYYEFSRTAVLHHRLFELFGLRTIPTLRHLAVAIASCVRLHLRCLRHAEPGQPVERASRALALAVAWPLGQYIGGRRGARGVGSHPVDGV